MSSYEREHARKGLACAKRIQTPQFNCIIDHEQIGTGWFWDLCVQCLLFNALYVSLHPLVAVHLCLSLLEVVVQAVVHLVHIIDVEFFHILKQLCDECVLDFVIVTNDVGHIR